MYNALPPSANRRKTNEPMCLLTGISTFEGSTGKKSCDLIITDDINFLQISWDSPSPQAFTRKTKKTEINPSQYVPTQLHVLLCKNLELNISCQIDPMLQDKFINKLPDHKPQFLALLPYMLTSKLRKNVIIKRLSITLIWKASMLLQRMNRSLHIAIVISRK